MFKSNRSSNRQQQPGWRDYQADLRRETAPRRPWKPIIFRTAAIALLAGVAIFGLLAFFRHASHPTPAATEPPKSVTVAELTGKEDVRQLLDEKAFNNLTKKSISLPVNGQLLQVETSLDADLQNYLLEKLDRENSRYVGIVVMDAATGQVLSMAGFDKTDPNGNPCLRSDFPAASVFKMVTAASAVDQFGYTADSPINFNGYKHTLYKQQLTDKVSRYTTRVTFRKAFAESINPVFGKLGGLQLRKPLLEKSAAAFGFNEPLDFELPLPPSHFQVGEEPYNWAEVASGFNLETTISPLHGAVMASAVLNGGQMVAPSLIENIVDDKGKVLYKYHQGWERQAMSPKAATVLSQLMETTITSGTGRKSFRNHSRDKILSRLQIGGKTGSIGSKSHDVRYDLFVGFARERLGKGQIVVSVMVAHEKYIGTRACDYARMAITRYFDNRF